MRRSARSLRNLSHLSTVSCGLVTFWRLPPSPAPIRSSSSSTLEQIVPWPSSRSFRIGGVPFASITDGSGPLALGSSVIASDIAPEKERKWPRAVESIRNARFTATHTIRRRYRPGLWPARVSLSALVSSLSLSQPYVKPRLYGAASRVLQPQPQSQKRASPLRCLDGIEVRRGGIAHTVRGGYAPPSRDEPNPRTRDGRFGPPHLSSAFSQSRRRSHRHTDLNGPIERD